MYSLLPIASASFFLFQGIFAESPECDKIRSYTRFNASSVIKVPALGAREGESLRELDVRDSWELEARVVSTMHADGQSSALLHYNLRNEHGNDMYVCPQGLRVFDDNEWLFSKEVMRRATEDEGDCKRMLGESCVEALKDHYRREGKRYAEKEGCPSSDLDDQTSVDRNTTVPYQCAGLVGGREEWAKGDSTVWSEVVDPLRVDIPDLFDNFNCTVDTEIMHRHHNTVSHVGTVNGSYNHLIRFPTPIFLTFFKIERFVDNSKQEPWVEARCVIPDDEFSKDSIEPPSAQELLDDGEAKWNENATDPPAEEENEDPSPTQSTGGVSPMKTAAPMLGAVGVAAMLLV